MTISVWGLIPQKASHCSPLLHCNFSQGVVVLEKFSHCIPLQPTPPWKFQSGGNSKVVPLQPIAAHSYMAILVRWRGVIPQKYSHCSPTLRLLPPKGRQKYSKDKLNKNSGRKNSKTQHAFTCIRNVELEN